MAVMKLVLRLKLVPLWVKRELLLTMLLLLLVLHC
jgi:hypothetical protein